jgi:hypothetical protein
MRVDGCGAAPDDLSSGCRLGVWRILAVGRASWLLPGMPIACRV